MALKTTKRLDLAAITGIAGLASMDAQQIGRLDRLEFDTRPGEAKLTLGASTYGSQEAVTARSPIPGADEEITFRPEAQPAIEAILDPETNEVLEPAVPEVPSFAQLLASPIRSQRAVATFGDLWKWVIKELYLRWVDQKTHWQGSTEV